MTLFCLLSCAFTAGIPDLDKDLDVVFLLGLYGVCVLDLLGSLEWADKLLCNEDSLVVCHSGDDGCWSDSVRKCFCGGIHPL